MTSLAVERVTTAELLLRWYKRWMSPLFGNSCRFTPTCSEYAAQAVAEHGWWRGSMLAAGRLLRCHPFSRGGHDPVPAGVVAHASIKNSF
jgi:putative membrane protein insertion efficiency factor